MCFKYYSVQFYKNVLANVQLSAKSLNTPSKTVYAQVLSVVEDKLNHPTLI